VIGESGFETQACRIICQVIAAYALRLNSRTSTEGSTVFSLFDVNTESQVTFRRLVVVDRLGIYTFGLHDCYYVQFDKFCSFDMNET